MVIFMLQTLYRQIGEYKKDSILTPIFTALEVFMEILIPFVTASIIDKGIEAGNMQMVCLYGAVMLILAFSVCFSEFRPGVMQPLPLPDSPVICVKACMPIFRLFPSQILINIVRPGWLHV